MTDDRIARRLDENDLRWFITRTDAQSQAVLFSYLSRAVAEIRTCWATITALSAEKEDGPAGQWICRTCGFTLTKAWLRADDGAVAVDDRPIEDICPNDGSPLRRLTWKEDAENANRVGLEQMKRADAAEQERDKLADAIAPYRHTPEDRELWETNNAEINIQALVKSVLNMRDVGELNQRLEHELELVKLDHQETRGTVAAWQQRCRELETANGEISEQLSAEIDRLTEGSARLAQLEQENKALLEEHRNIAEPGRAARNLTRLIQAMGMCDTCAAPLVEDDEPCIRCAKCETSLVDTAAILRAALEQLLAYPQGMMIPGHDDKGYVLLSWVHETARKALAHSATQRRTA